MRNGTLPAMAGNPPADAAHPSGMNGMIVTVPRNAPQEPRAPRIPSRLYQNPRNKSTADDHSDHRRANQVVVEILVEEAELGQGVDEPVHGLVPSLWPYDDAPRVPVPATTTEPGHALRGNTPTTTSPVTPPISPSTRRLSPLVSPGRYSVTIRMAETADCTVITAPPSSKTATDI